MRKVIVYDFDKTLTYKDTLFGFFYASLNNGLFSFPKLTIYIGSMILTKFHVISNQRLKEIGVAFFLKGLNKKALEKLVDRYKELIPFNRVYNELSFEKENKYFIVSASFEEYLCVLFPHEVKVIGSRLSYKNGVVQGLAFNCYQEAKVEALRNNGIKTIDVLYTDSFSDEALAKIAKKIVIVSGDKEIEVYNIDEFKRYFNR